MKTPLKIAAILIVAAISLGAPRSAEGGKHPSLVNTESTQCNLCHEDLVSNKASVHSPVSDDCALCHEFSKGEDGTSVEFAEPEPALCLMCHSEVESAAALEVATPHMPMEESCLNCHEAHGSDVEPLLVAQTSEVCAMCHDLEELNEVHGGQLTEQADCTSCHAPHGSEHPSMLVAATQHAPFTEGSCTACHRQPFGERIRLRSRGERLCTACHGEFPEHENGSVHQPLQGSTTRASCLKCHSPHMSPHTALLVQGGSDLCQECHEEIVSAATADTGHYPAAEDCSNCHQPHTADQVALLVEPPDSLCETCHDLEDEDLSGTHLGADLSSLTCTECHSPHGAGHPSLLEANLHAALEDGCDLCHEGAYNQLAEDGGAELCTMCHDDIGDLASSSAVPHAAMELDGCVACHNPHATKQAKLVKAPGAGPCADCHEDQVAGEGEFSHGVIDLLGCRACHEPHGGDNPKLLRASGTDLCLSCHKEGGPREDLETGSTTLLGVFDVATKDVTKMTLIELSPDGTRGHPVLEHRTLGLPTEDELLRTDSTFDGELKCLTCHDPHKGKGQELFQWGARNVMEACQNCHQK